MCQTVSTVLIVLVSAVLTMVSCHQCLYPMDPTCKEIRWQVGADKLGPGGVRVHGNTKFPVHNSPSQNVQGAVHGSHTFGGPQNGAQTVGGGLNYQHSSGLHGGADATHTRGQGTTYSAGVGGSTKVGPGTLSVGGNAAQYPGSSKVHGQVGATYTVPLP